MSLKVKIEERLLELRQALSDTEAQLWAIRGAIQELETVIVPMIEADNAGSDTDTSGPE